MFETAQVTLPSDREVKVVRSFKAARALVYRASTEPELVKQWMLGPPGWTMPVCEMDVRVGGRYRWVWRSEAGDAEFGFSGVYREVEPAVRIVHTERFEAGTLGGPFPGAEALITVTFDEENGVTTLTSLMDFGSKEARDAAVATGMTDGMEQSYQRLERTLGGASAGASTTAE
ncbi:MAG: SRPBCC family protein [Vicinamibacterales bacterium]